MVKPSKGGTHLLPSSLTSKRPHHRARREVSEAKPKRNHKAGTTPAHVVTRPRRPVYALSRTGRSPGRVNIQAKRV